MSIGRRAAALLALVSVLPAGLVPVSALDGQQAPRAFARANRPSGWIGITFDLELSKTWQAGTPEPEAAMVIAQVYDGSPAQRVGLQVGDSIVRINQRPVSWDAVSRLQAALQPGTEVSFQYRRGGRMRSVDLRASARPADDELAVLPQEVRDRVESAQALLLQHLDSAARVGLFAGAPSRTLVMFGAPGDSMVLTFPTPGVAPVPSEDAFDGGWTIAFGPAPTFGTAPASFEGVVARRPAQVVGIAPRSLEPAQRPVITPLESMRREMEATAQALATREEHRRPLAPYIQGQDVVAGARLTPLNAGLADYFAVSRGLLVIQVVEGTNAADAGVLPGDVIIASGQRSVTTIEELRELFRAARGARFVPLTLVRKTRRIEVAVPR
jgi:membrane-associated protease RseP (regulator of RpoE activity)